MSFVIIYDDNGGIMDTPGTVREINDGFSRSFEVKTMGEMDIFEGCHFIDTFDKEGLRIHQPKLIRYLKARIYNLYSTRIYKTPSAPRTLILRPKERDPFVPLKNMKPFRMDVGLTLY
jgi:hypothetical protein